MRLRQGREGAALLGGGLADHLFYHHPARREGRESKAVSGAGSQKAPLPSRWACAPFLALPPPPLQWPTALQPLPAVSDRSPGPKLASFQAAYHTAIEHPSTCSPSPCPLWVAQAPQGSQLTTWAWTGRARRHLRSASRTPATVLACPGCRSPGCVKPGMGTVSGWPVCTT